MSPFKCPNDEPHEGHQYTIRADGITVAGGYCIGTRSAVTDAEYRAAWTEWCESGNFRSALEAAARARQENRDG